MQLPFSLLFLFFVGNWLVICSSDQQRFSHSVLLQKKNVERIFTDVLAGNEIKPTLMTINPSPSVKHAHKHSISPFTLVINLIADLCPHGMLPLAFGFAQGGPNGIIPSILLMLLFGTMSGYTMTTYANLANITGSSTISEIWSKLISQKTAWIIDAAIFALCYGCCIFYSAFIGDIFGALASMLNLKGAFGNRTNILIAITSIILLPLCLQEDLSALQFSSFLGAFGVIFTAGVHIKRLLDGTYAPGSSMLQHIATKLRPSFPETGKFNLWNLNFGSLMLANLFCVAFLAHYNSINYFKELNSSLATYQKTVSIGFVIATTVFTIMMFVGYQLFGLSSLPLILNNFPKRKDNLAVLARVATGAAITFAYPLMFAGLKSALISWVNRVHPKSENDPDSKRLKLSLLVASLASITAIACKCGEEDVSVVLGFVGSISGCFVAYVLPAWLNLAHMRARKNVGLPNNRIESVANHALAALGVFFGILGVYVTLYPSDSHHH